MMQWKDFPDQYLTFFNAGIIMPTPTLNSGKIILNYKVIKVGTYPQHHQVQPSTSNTMTTKSFQNVPCPLIFWTLLWMVMLMGWAMLFQCSAALWVWKVFLWSSLSLPVQFKGNFSSSCHLFPGSKDQPPHLASAPFLAVAQREKVLLEPLSLPVPPAAPHGTFAPEPPTTPWFTWFLCWLPPEWTLVLWPSVSLF